MSDYPEHEKLGKITDKSQICGEFLDWLRNERGIVLADWSQQSDILYPVHISTMNLLAEFFGIDPVKIENEKRAMLDETRAIN